MGKSVKTLIAVIIITVAVAFFDAFALMFVWNKFVPAATGGLFPVINYWLAYGLMLLVDLFTLRVTKAKDETPEIPELFVYAIIKVAFKGALIGIAALISLGI